MAGATTLAQLHLQEGAAAGAWLQIDLLSTHVQAVPFSHTHWACCRCLQVLDSFMYADRELLTQRPELASARVYVHFQSSQQVRAHM